MLRPHENLVEEQTGQDSSEINNYLLFISFKLFKPYTVPDQLFMTTGSEPAA
jgi:hypothetical protein